MTVFVTVDKDDDNTIELNSSARKKKHSVRQEEEK